MSSGKLLERMDFKGEPRWAKDVTFKAFGETRTNAQLMAWRQQMLDSPPPEPEQLQPPPAPAIAAS